MRTFRPSIRLRLTLWYGGLFLLAGILLFTLNYFLVRNHIAPSAEQTRAVVAQRLGIPEQMLEPYVRPFGMERPMMVSGVAVGRIMQEVQRELTDQALRRLLFTSGIALAIMAVASLGLGYLVAGRMLRPVHEIAGAARRLSESTLHQRIDLKGPRDELKDLADTFDGMLGRLDKAFRAQKDFVANASHELRTPLTIIRTEVDVALADPDLSREELVAAANSIRDAVDRSERLIDALLVLARTDGEPARSPVDLAELVQDQVSLHSAAADTLGLSLDLKLQPAATSGDHALLERLAGNLIENAIHHNQPGGWFAVSTFAHNSSVHLVVENSGQVVPADEAEKLFDRFYRPDRSRSRKTGGVGLGLSIVKAVAAAHGGKVALEARPEGGLRVDVELPAGASGPNQASDKITTKTPRISA
jgi:signal transduction histidine kinase